MTDLHVHRRRWPRQAVRVECQIEGISSRASIRLSDLSLGGGYVDTTANLAVGNPVRLVMILEGIETPVIGHVVYTHRGMGFGLSFDSQQMPQETRDRIAEFLKQRGGGAS